jgi:hypothetical protein
VINTKTAALALVGDLLLVVVLHQHGLQQLLAPLAVGGVLLGIYLGWNMR